MTYVVGLTGGIASGKTTVANLFQQHFDIDIVDADIIAREVVDIGSTGLAKIREHFGQSVIQTDGALDRAALRQLIFENEENKQWLNALLHPLIREKMIHDLQHTSSPYALLVVPLLIENKLQSLVDRVLVVDVSEEVQIQRTMARDKVSEDQAQAILNAQTNRSTRLALADDIIENSEENNRLLPIITELHKKYLAFSAQNR